MNDVNVIWVPRKKGSDFYAFEMTDILVGEKSIGITDLGVYNDGDAIIDSGSSECCLPSPALSALK